MEHRTGHSKKQDTLKSITEVCCFWKKPNTSHLQQPHGAASSSLPPQLQQQKTPPGGHQGQDLTPWHMIHTQIWSTRHREPRAIRSSPAAWGENNRKPETPQVLWPSLQGTGAVLFLVAALPGCYFAASEKNLKSSRIKKQMQPKMQRDPWK